MLRLYVESRATKTSAVGITTEIPIKSDYQNEIHESIYIETKMINQIKWTTKLITCKDN